MYEILSVIFKLSYTIHYYYNDNYTVLHINTQKISQTSAFLQDVSWKSQPMSKNVSLWKLHFQRFVTKKGYTKIGYYMIIKVFIIYITCYTVQYIGLNVDLGSFSQPPPSPDLNLIHTQFVTTCTISHTAPQWGITCR